MVVGGEGAGWSFTVCGFVVPYRGGQGEHSLQDSGGDAGSCPAAVAFEVELAFEGLID